MYLRFIGGILVFLGSVSVGCYIAYMMKMRIKQLKELKRIINNLEGEIYYKHSILKEACNNASLRCIYPFNTWLEDLCCRLDSYSEESFGKLWKDSLYKLYENSFLKKDDIEMFCSIGQSIGYLDIETQKNNLELEKKSIDGVIFDLEKCLSNKMKIAYVGGILCGILILMLII